MMRKDDDLLRLAFGELADDAARAVEARADADDRLEIASFRELREGLLHLPTPPPDGLSAERLRAAILDREIQTRRKPFAWPVLFAPAALAALAAVVLLPRFRTPAEPRLALNETRIDASTFDVPPLAPFESKAPIVAPTLDIAQAKVAKAIASEAPRPSIVRPSRRKVRRSFPPVERPEPARELVALNVKHADQEAPPSLALVKAPPTIATPPSAVVEVASGVTSDTEAVVIVSHERDLATGAPAATEKEATSVLVGG